MFEKKFQLDSIDPLEIYGVNNTRLDKIRSFFPKLKIVARGNTIKAMGDEEAIFQFEKKLEALVDYFHQFNKITDDVVNGVMAQGETLSNGMAENDDVLVFGNNGKPIRARTPNQRKLVEAGNNNDMLFAIGPAGTGKTYTAIAMAVKALKNKEIRKIILSRPAVEAGERLGFLPGDLKEKIDPYLQPLYDALGDMIPPKKLEAFIQDKVIEIAPLAFMRGRTLSNAFVILDEAQNSTINQLKMFLTRMGLNTKFIITGDETQIDLPRRNDSGLLQAMRILNNIEGISIVQFDKGDIVRHKLVRQIVAAYEQHQLETEAKLEAKKTRAERN